MYGSRTPVARRNEIVVQELQDEVLVFDTSSNKAHCLNSTAAAVWKLCDGKNTVSEINQIIEKNVGAKVSENLIFLAIDQLNEKDLFEQKIEQKFAGNNRREVIKKIGLAAVVALPIVASITAPTAAYAVACSGIVTSCLGCPTNTPCDVNMNGTIGMCLTGGCSGD